MRALLLFTVCCVLLVTTAHAQSATELKILATDPAVDTLLARQQPFFVRFELKTAAPATVTVTGLFKGKAVIDDGGNGAPAKLPAGSGSGVVSFFYWGEKPTRIDEVRLQVNDASNGATITEYAFPVAITWLTDDAPPREPAAWVKEWQQAQLAPKTAVTSDAAATDAPIKPRVWYALAAGLALIAAAFLWLRRKRAPADDAETRR